MPPYKKVKFVRRKKVSAALSEAVGIVHGLVAVAIAIVGQNTKLFRLTILEGDYPGLEFVYKWIDYPVYIFFKPLVEKYKEHYNASWIIGISVILAASVLYSLVGLIVFRILGKTFSSPPEFPRQNT